MNDIKKPKWDRQINHTAAGSYGPNTVMDRIDIGMTAKAQYKSVDVSIKITKVINKHDIEGTIINIFSKTETVGDLSVGDPVFVDRWSIKHHS